MTGIKKNDLVAGRRPGDQIGERGYDSLVSGLVVEQKADICVFEGKLPQQQVAKCACIGFSSLQLPERGGMPVLINSDDKR
jgi:hypothetical protein